MKRCNRCNEQKPLEAFHANSIAPDKRQYHCKECAAIYTKTHQRDNPDKWRGYRLATLYNMPQRKWEQLFNAQGNVCAICKSPVPRNTKYWYTDHNHKTNKIRGILCQPCNIILGNAMDDVTILRNAIDYLLKE